MAAPTLEANDDDDDDDDDSSYVPDDPTESEEETDHEAEQEAFQLDDSKYVPQGTQLTLPPRNVSHAPSLNSRDGDLPKWGRLEIDGGGGATCAPALGWGGAPGSHTAV